MTSKRKNYPKIVIKKIYLVSLPFLNRARRKLAKFWQRIKVLPTLFNIDVNFSKKPNTILLVSSGRSGSTWIASMISHANGYRFIFEPFHHLKCLYMEQFPKWVYLPIGESFSPIEENILNQAVKGQVQSKWVNKFNKRVFSHKRLIKSIKVHFILHWFWVKFQIPIFYLIRHPLAVISSIMKYNEIDPNWTPDIEPFLENSHLMNQLTFLQQEKVKSARTLLQKQLVIWCLTNAFALRQLENIPHHLIFYENVHNNPIHEMKKAYNFLEKPFGKRRIRLINKKTEIRFIDIEKSNNSSLDKWKTFFSEEEKQEAQTYLHIFELDHIYSVEYTFPLKINIGMPK